MNEALPPTNSVREIERKLAPGISYTTHTNGRAGVSKYSRSHFGSGNGGVGPLLSAKGSCSSRFLFRSRFPTLTCGEDPSLIQIPSSESLSPIPYSLLSSYLTVVPSAGFRLLEKLIVAGLAAHAHHDTPLVDRTNWPPSQRFHMISYPP